MSSSWVRKASCPILTKSRTSAGCGVQIRVGGWVGGSGGKEVKGQEDVEGREEMEGPQQTL